MNTYHDSMIEEIHKTREKLKGQYAGDITAYSKDAFAHCKAMGFKFATLDSISNARLSSPRDNPKTALLDSP